MSNLYTLNGKLLALRSLLIGNYFYLKGKNYG